MATPGTDDFTGADGDLDSAKWDGISGLKRSGSGTCVQSFATGAMYASWKTSYTAENEQFAELKITTIPAWDWAPGPAVRGTAADIGVGYQASIQTYNAGAGGTIVLRRGATAVRTATNVVSAGDTVKIVANSSTGAVSCYINDSLVTWDADGAYTDGTPLTGGYPGMYVYYGDSGGTPDFAVDDFRAGDGNGTATITPKGRMMLLGVG